MVSVFSIIMILANVAITCVECYNHRSYCTVVVPRVNNDKRVLNTIWPHRNTLCEVT